MLRKELVLLVVLFAIQYAGKGQTEYAGFLKSRFEKYKEQSSQEKIFVHTDRPNYLAGETVWFKVYCINEDNNKTLRLSKVAYIEVLDKNQQPVLQAKIALKDGTGNGSLILPLNIQSGNYIFRAYTSWMKNFDDAYYFHQPITIINTIQIDTLTTQKADERYTASFYPEGGEMVDNLTSKVAFRVTDNAGKGVNFKGIIVDGNNDTLLSFSPSKFGIGSFNLTPKYNNTYKAIITTLKGSVITQNLPAVLKNGVVMNVSEDESNGKLSINIQNTTEGSFVYLFVHSRQHVKAAELIDLKNGYARFELDKDNLGEGISHITIFDRNYEPLCERLYFKKPSQQLRIETTTDSMQFPPRKNVSIGLFTKNEAGMPQAANMSMAVFLIDSLHSDYKDIYSYLWLLSDLTVDIESPSYYFKNNGIQVREQLDNLMLTHGWRKFKWREVLQHDKKVFKFLPEYEGHIISGRVLNHANSPVANKIALLSVPDRNFQLYSSISSSDGIVHFNTKNLYGTKLIVATIKPDSSTPNKIELINPFSETASFQGISFSTNLSKPQSMNLLKRSINMQVQNIYQSKESYSYNTTNFDTSLFYGTPSVTYLLEDYTRFSTMEEVLREYVREIVVRKKNNDFVLSMPYKDDFNLYHTKKPIILLDGIPQFDEGNAITSYDPLKVKKLELVTDTYILGPAKFDGIASFATYSGDAKDFKLDTASIAIDYEALQLRREFSSPVYKTREQYTSRMPDFRNLLFWSPDIKTENDGRLDTSFYTSDLPGKYAVVVQGISKEGKSGSEMFIIEVKGQDNVGEKQ